MSRAPLSRRTVLRGAGGVAIALPLLDAMLPRRACAQLAPPPRLVIFFSSCGVVQKSWAPVGTGPSFALSRILEPLAPLKDKLLVLSGVDMATALTDAGNEHARGMAHMLTCTRLIIDQSLPIGGKLPVGYAGGISIDQEIARQVGGATRLPSLELGVGTTREWGAHPYSRMSYVGPNAPVPAIDSPSQAFDRLVSKGLGTASGSGTEILRAQRRSVLDMVEQDFAQLAPRLGKDDAQKLDRHLAGLREIERGLQAPLAPTSGGSCKGTAPDTSDASFPGIGKAQMNILATALACNITRVASLQWGSSNSQVIHKWVGATRGHHDYSHDPDSNAGTQEMLTRIDAWFAQQLAYLGGLLDARNEAGGTVLDNTAILWVTEVAVGNTHSFRGLPYVILGSCGGRLKTGQHLKFSGVPHNNLMIALARAMGVDLKTFGDPRVSSGPLPILAT
jgi:hypothetical protein